MLVSWNDVRSRVHHDTPFDALDIGIEQIVNVEWMETYKTVKSWIEDTLRVHLKPVSVPV